MPCSENGIAIVVAILVIMRDGREIEESNSYMKFGRNSLIECPQEQTEKRQHV